MWTLKTASVAPASMGTQHANGCPMTRGTHGQANTKLWGCKPLAAILFRRDISYKESPGTCFHQRCSQMLHGDIQGYSHPGMIMIYPSPYA